MLIVGRGCVNLRPLLVSAMLACCCWSLASLGWLAGKLGFNDPDPWPCLTLPTHPQFPEVSQLSQLASPAHSIRHPCAGSDVSLVAKEAAMRPLRRLMAQLEGETSREAASSSGSGAAKDSRVGSGGGGRGSPTLVPGQGRVQQPQQPQQQQGRQREVRLCKLLCCAAAGLGCTSGKLACLSCTSRDVVLAP